MKKILFLVIVLFSTQIVNASDIKDATLKNKGTQNEASTIAWLKSDVLDGALINMDTKHFSSGFTACLREFNDHYKSFPVVNSDVIYDEIIPNLYTKDLVPGRLYWFSYWNATTQSWGRWQRAAKPGETGLFYPGWGDDPIMSVYCWNFGYPTTEKVVVTKPPIQRVMDKPQDEYVYYPGKTKTIEYGADTVFISRSKVQIETNNNKVVQFNNNQSYEVDMNQYASNKQQYNNCNCPQQQQQVNNCGCNGKDICQRHYDQLPKKEKKNFFNTTGGRLLTHGLALATGYGLRMVVENNTNLGGQFIRRPGVEQPPVEILTSVIEQPPLRIFN